MFSDKLNTAIPIIQQVSNIESQNSILSNISYQVSQDYWALLSTEEAGEYIKHLSTATTDTYQHTLLLPADVYIKNVSLHQYKNIGVYLNSDEELSIIEEFLDNLPVVAFYFETFRDGRAYSKAFMLKTRLNFHGQIRAVGDVLRDQMAYMARCGFNTFVVRADKNIEDALNAFKEFSRTYQTDALQNKPNYI